MRRVSAIGWAAIGLIYTVLGLGQTMYEPNSSDKFPLVIGLVALPAAFAAHKLSCWLVKWIVTGFTKTQ
jgi:hypothetical protein